MASTEPTEPTTRRPMSWLRKVALLAGALYLVTFLSSIPAVFLLDPVLSDPGYIVGPGDDTRVLLGGLLDIVNALACIGTAVVLYPVVRRENEALALGFVAARVLEAAIIFVGVMSILTVVTLRQDLGSTPGADADSLITTGEALVALRDWTFLLGPGLAVANALLLGTLMYRSRLVPRVIPLLGLVGAPLLLASNTATMFGVNDQFSLLSLVALPGIFFWELSLGVYLVVRGFRPSPVTAGLDANGGRAPVDVAAGPAGPATTAGGS
ncbi:DUF4386 domain-containing protein [Georgenia daeguensis]